MASNVKNKMQELFAKSAKFQQKQIEASKQLYTRDERILKLEIGNKYKLRLLFYCDESLSDRKTPFIYGRVHQFYDSFKHRYSDKVICPQSQHIEGVAGRNTCPICQAASAAWHDWKNNGVKSSRTFYNKIKSQTENYAVVYVVEDMKHPENNGKSMIIKFGYKFENFFQQEIYGINKDTGEIDADMDAYGISAFALDENGYDLLVSVSKTKVDDNEFPDYNIKFAKSPSAVAITEDDLPEIFEKLKFDKDFYKTTTTEALKAWYDKYVISEVSNEESNKVDDLDDDSDLMDDIDENSSKTKVVKKTDEEDFSKNKVSKKSSKIPAKAKTEEDDDDDDFDFDNETSKKSSKIPAKVKTEEDDDDDFDFDDDFDEDTETSKKSSNESVKSKNDEEDDEWNF